MASNYKHVCSAQNFAGLHENSPYPFPTKCCTSTLFFTLPKNKNFPGKANWKQIFDIGIANWWQILQNLPILEISATRFFEFSIKCIFFLNSAIFTQFTLQYHPTLRTGIVLSRVFVKPNSVQRYLSGAPSPAVHYVTANELQYRNRFVNTKSRIYRPGCVSSWHGNIFEIMYGAPNIKPKKVNMGHIGIRASVISVDVRNKGRLATAWSDKIFIRPEKNLVTTIRIL